MKCMDTVSLDDIGQDGEYLVAFAKTARTGVQTYLRREVGLDGDGTVTINRPESQVFDKASVESFTNIPITMDHPANGVSSENFRAEAIGVTTGDVMRDGDHIRFGLKIMDKTAIEKIKAGKRELSGGYDHDIDWTPGITSDGIHYDGSQINIRGNHIAVVDRGRAGSARIGDSASVEQWGAAPVATQDKGHEMLIKFTVDGKPLEATPESAVTTLQTALDSSVKAVEAKSGEVDTLKSQIEKLTGENETLTKKAKDAEITPAVLNQMAADRAAVLDRVKAITGKDADVTASTSDLRRAAVRHYIGDSAADWTEEKIGGSFDTIPVGPKASPFSNLGPVKVNDAANPAFTTADTAALLKRNGIKAKKEA